MAEWCDRFWGMDSQPPVEEVSIPAGIVASHASSLSGRSQCTRGMHGGRSQWSLPPISAPPQETPPLSAATTGSLG